MKKIITISRLYGAGGGEIGHRVADALGIEYYDRDMVMKTALMDPKLDSKMVSNWEKKKPSKWGLAHTLYDWYSKPMDDQIFNAQKEAILKMANEESCVIIGRNANFILSEFDHTLHVFVHAGFKWRVNRMSAMYPDTDQADIILETKEIDKARKKNCAYYFDRDLTDATGYDLCINTEKAGIDEAVRMILEAVEKMN